MSLQNPKKLHIYFLPGMAPGHMIPMIDIARKFAKLGTKSTIITTPLNASPFTKTIENDRENGCDINITLIRFPTKEAGLPEGCENLSSITSPAMTISFFNAFDFFQEPVEKIIREGERVDCIVAGIFFWWATDVAKKFGVPRLVFYGTGFFPMCVYRSLKEHRPHDKVGSDDEEFVVPGVPSEIRLSRRQIPDTLKEGDRHWMAEIAKKIEAADFASYGKIVNSFYELEADYVKHYKEEGVGRKAWCIGPVSLFNNSNENKSVRKKGDYDCLSWLDEKKPDSVVYVCFGSMASFSSAELLEIAKGLEASGQQFVWVVREKAKNDGSFGLFMEDFERRVKDRGLVIKGWAPQVAILDHKAVGGFVTHCGWNSLLEGVAAGLPMVTWPLSAEQFFNEKLVGEVLKTGIPVGAQEWTSRTDDREPLKGENIGKTIAKLMVGEEAEIIRSRARKLGEMAKKAVEKGGSSDNDLHSLLEEIRAYPDL